MGQLPSGDYDICVDVINAATGDILGTDCVTQEVLLVSQVALVYPTDALTLLPENKYPIFTWIPPVPVAKGTQLTYKLKIVDVYGMQSGYDAMQSNPLYYSNSSIKSTSFQ
jgi:hypothetical protein